MQKDTGASVRIYNIAKGLAARGHDVHVIVPKNKTSNKRLDGVTIHEVKGFTPVAVLRVFKRFVGVFRPTALYFYDFLFLLRVSNLIIEGDIVQIEQPSSGGLLNPIIHNFLKKRVVVDCHDVFQALRVKNTSISRRILETFLEKTAYKNANLLLTVSDVEKGCLESFGFRNRSIAVVPNGVDTQHFKKSAEVENIRKKYGLTGFQTVVFVGNLSYIPNLEAIRLLSSVIVPKVSEQLGNVKFLVVGKLQSELQLPGLLFTGFVDNVADILSVADVAVAPLYRGSGTRLKILEYLSCGLPVVSTSIAAEGLDIRNGVNIFIEDDINRFAVRIVDLLHDKQLSTIAGSAARELAKTTYDWKNIVQELEKDYCGLLLE